MLASLTRNPFDDISSMSKTYDSSTYSSATIQLLSKHCYKSSFATNRLFNIKSCEIDNKLQSSPTQNMIDVLYQSGIAFPELLNVSNKMSILRDEYHSTFNKFHTYHSSFNTAAFPSFHTYFASSDAEKYTGNASESIMNASKIYNHLLKKSAQMKPNTLIQVEARTSLTPCTNNNASDADEKVADDDEDEDGDDEYSQQIQNSRSVKENNEQQKQYGSIDDVEAEMKRFSILDSQNSIDRVMQKGLTPLNNEPFNYQHIEMKLKGDEVKICETNNTVPNCVIEYKQSLNMILNSINSIYNTINTLTFLFIVYHDLIMVYAYITNSNGKSFGSRIFEQDLVTKIPLLFADTNISLAAQNEVNNYLTFKEDTVFEEYKWILFTGFDLIKVQNAVNRWNKYRRMNNMDLAEIQNIFIRNNITKQFFAEENNRPSFIKLLQKHDLILAAADHLWYSLDGVPFDVNIDVNIDMKEDGNTDLDLDIFSWITNNNNDDIELKSDVPEDNDIDNDALQINDKEDDKVDVEAHKEVSYNHVSPSPILQNNDDTHFEDPPWSEYENDSDDYDAQSNFINKNCDLLIHHQNTEKKVIDDSNDDINDSVHADIDTNIDLYHRYPLIPSISANVYNNDNPRASNESPDQTSIIIPFMPNNMRYYDQLPLDRPPWEDTNVSTTPNASTFNTGPAAPNLLPTMPPYIAHGQTATILPSLPPSGYPPSSVPTYLVNTVLLDPTTSAPTEYSSTTPTF